MMSRVARRCLSTAAMPKPNWYERHIIEDELIEANGGLLEYSVVYTDRALNHMSEPFQRVMTDLHASLTSAYKAETGVLIPGSGTYAMEAAARAFGGGDVLVVRNGYFSYRWSQIFETMGKDVHVMRAKPVDGWDGAVAPPDVDEVVSAILDKKPSMVAAPHVETSAGIILPPEYIKKIGDAANQVGAVFVLDGVASGTAWVDMEALGVDCYVTAPQKGWSGPAAVGVAMLSAKGLEAARAAQRSSFVVDMAKWHDVMTAYLNGGHMYHATMPTDAIRTFRDVVHETEDFGLDRAQDECWRLGNGVRAVLADAGFKSVAAPGYEAPGVAVVHAPDASYAAKFKGTSLQIAAGVPLMLGEPPLGSEFNTFRIGLFGLDKLKDVDLTIANFQHALANVQQAA